MKQTALLIPLIVMSIYFWVTVQQARFLSNRILKSQQHPKSIKHINQIVKNSKFPWLGKYLKMIHFAEYFKGDIKYLLLTSKEMRPFFA